MCISACILEYRDFHDVPRLILAADEAGDLWILDCKFSDELDEYQDNYDLFFVGQRGSLKEVLPQYLGGGVGKCLRSVPVKDIEFDESLRRRLRVRNGGGWKK